MKKKKLYFCWGPRSYSDAMSLTQRLLTSNCAWTCVHVRHLDAHRHPHRSTYVYTYTHTHKYMDTNTHKWRHTHISTYSSQSCQGEAAWLWSHKTSQKEQKRKWQLKSPHEEEGEKGSLKCSLTHRFSGARWARMKRPLSGAHKGSRCNSRASLAPTQNEPSQTPDD